MSKQTTPGFIHQFEPGSSNRTLLLLHGTGGNEKDLLSLGRALDPEAALLSPRGKVLENGMPRFFRRLAEGVFDEEDLIRRAHELADFVSEAAAHYGFDAEKVVAVGYKTRKHRWRHPLCCGPVCSAAWRCCGRCTAGSGDASGSSPPVRFRRQSRPIGLPRMHAVIARCARLELT
jgi:hypothetical protein